MTQNIKSFWVRLGSIFLTFYFMPVSNFIRSVLGMPPMSGGAVAGTLTYGGLSQNCPGVASQTATFGTTYVCTCETDSSQKMNVILQDEIYYTWDDGCSCINEVVDVYFSVSECYSATACSPDGTTQDCSTTSRNGTKTCQDGNWTSCVWGDCKSGYVMVGNSCYASCDMTNGEGYETDALDSSSSSTTSEG